MQDIYGASIDGIDLEIADITDSFEKSIARYEFPYRDGALLEDMGQRARVIKFRCFFWDDGADHDTYNDHIDLINHLKSKDYFVLVHPTYGTVKGCVESVSVRHDEREMHAEIDISFVENLPDATAELAYVDVESVIEELILAAQEQQAAELEQDLADEGFDTKTALDPDKSLLEQLKGGTAALRNMTKEMDGFLGKMNATANEVMQPVNSLISTVNYAANLPGRMLGIITKMVERVAKLYTTLKNFPDRLCRNLNFALKKLINSFAAFGGSSKGSIRIRAIMIKHLTIASAQIMTLELAASYKVDQKARQALLRTEGVTAFDNAGNFLAPDPQPDVATVTDLESSLAISRDMLQEAIDQARMISALRDMALALLRHVNTVKLDRENIIQVELDNPMPVHLVCLRYGLPYNAATRILAINSISNPNVTAGQVNVYVR